MSRSSKSRPRKPRSIKTMNDKEDFQYGAAMTMDDILSMQGITVADIALINDLQKSIKANKVISFLAEVQRGQGE